MNLMYFTISVMVSYQLINFFIRWYSRISSIELGILVWQDFQFACGVYPAHREFVSSVRKEAEDNVKRLRHHPSIALFCGNNEDYQMVLQWGGSFILLSLAQPLNLHCTGIGELPARKLYEEVLPDVVAELTDPPIPYHRGSPYGGKGWDTSDPTVGDVHQWNVWGGKELPYQEYDNLGGRFVRLVELFHRSRSMAHVYVGR